MRDLKVTRAFAHVQYISMCDLPPSGFDLLD